MTKSSKYFRPNQDVWNSHINRRFTVPFNCRTYNEKVEIVKWKDQPELNLSMDVKENSIRFVIVSASFPSSSSSSPSCIIIITIVIIVVVVIIITIIIIFS
ncbi:hypothetical protein ANN_13871 [Periplaneta americana]|uniref:SHSP domain-containing protein n=1 Tax=Periplaneta americana TaxID=6978 RepID=A0ABQ8SWA4_PERAM|nr:hypothetical protein ANN_13871 [Periplaneta americana]